MSDANNFLESTLRKIKAAEVLADTQLQRGTCFNEPLHYLVDVDQLHMFMEKLSLTVGSSSVMIYPVIFFEISM